MPKYKCSTGCCCGLHTSINSGQFKIGQQMRLGKRHTEETKENLRRAAVKQMSDPVMRSRIGNGVRGFTHTPEARKKIADASRGRIRKRAFVECQYCGHEFSYVIKRNFCSRLCKSRWEISHRAAKVCATCGKPIVIQIGRGLDRKYCSVKCVPKRINRHDQYITIYHPDHILARKDGWQMEHRIVLYDAIGYGPHACHWCGKEVSWFIPYSREGGLGVDHLDFDRANNVLSNLVPSCKVCNSNRRRKHGKTLNALLVRDDKTQQPMIGIDGWPIGGAK